MLATFFKSGSSVRPQAKKVRAGSSFQSGGQDRTLQLGAAVELAACCIQTVEAVGHSHRGQFRTAIESTLTQLSQCIPEHQIACKGFAVGEGVLTHTGHTGRKNSIAVHTSQTRAALKAPSPMVFRGVGKVDGFQIRAAVEGTIIDFLNTGGQCHGNHTGIALECLFTDDPNAVRNDNIGFSTTVSNQRITHNLKLPVVEALATVTSTSAVAPVALAVAVTIAVPAPTAVSFA